MEDFDDDELVSAARLGLDVEHFIKLPAGKLLVDRAMRDLNDALEVLLHEGDSASPVAREAHAQARAAAGTITYLKQAIQDGNDAVAQLNEEDHDE